VHGRAASKGVKKPYQFWGLRGRTLGKKDGNGVHVWSEKRKKPKGVPWGGEKALVDWLKGREGDHSGHGDRGGMFSQGGKRPRRASG